MADSLVGNCWKTSHMEYGLIPVDSSRHFSRKQDRFLLSIEKVIYTNLDNMDSAHSLRTRCVSLKKQFEANGVLKW